MPQKKITIAMVDNGPLVVSGLNSIRGADGAQIVVEETVHLCRCGGSSNKPFCDGTHAKKGFSGVRLTTTQLDREKDYEGAELTLHDNRAICSHAAFCVTNHGGVFDIKRRPWIELDGVSADEIVDAVNNCPSGALSYTIDGKRGEASPPETEVEVEKGGPYYVSGDVEFVSDLQPPNPRAFALCRCGASKNKPFCDGCHHDIEFD